MNSKSIWVDLCHDSFRIQETLEYKQVHFGMTLDEFKFIYFNEWFHRSADHDTWNALGLFVSTIHYFLGLSDFS